MAQNPFNRNGLASLDDLATPEWRNNFSILESVQTAFLASHPHCPDYPWPRDPLHNFIRIWEYPYVFHHLQSYLGCQAASILPQIVDLGSGATFFPFAVARLGARVIAIDADSRATASLDAAIGTVATGHGSVARMLCDARSIALSDESIDCVYCISVLEHIPRFEDVVAEVQRILRPGGLFLLTFDVGLREGCDLAPDDYRCLLDALRNAFTPLYPEEVIHPLRVLNSENSIYPLHPKQSALRHLVAMARALPSIYGKIRNRGLGQKHILSNSLLAGTYGACLKKADCHLDRALEISHEH